MGLGEMHDPGFAIMGIEPTVPVSQRWAGGLQSRRQHQFAAGIGLPQQCDNRVAPPRHNQMPWKVERLPRLVIVGEPTAGDRQMHMRVPFEIPPEGVKRGEDPGQTVFLAGRGLDRLRRQGTELGQQSAVVLKQDPELRRYREGQMLPLGVG